MRFLWPGITGGILQQIFLLVIAIIFSKEFEKRIFGQLLTYSKSTTVILFGKSLPYLFVMLAHRHTLLKLFYLALANLSNQWTMPIRDGEAALNRLTVQFDERMPRL